MDGDLVERLRLAAKPEELASVFTLTVVRCSLLREAADEIERLRRWKVEAMEVISRWDAIADSVPCELGQRRSDAVGAEMKRLRRENAEMEALLADADHDWRTDGNGTLLNSSMRAVGRFLEARRG